MTEANIVRLIGIGVSALLILVAVIIVAVNAATASKYKVYQGYVADYTRRATEDTCHLIVEFEADGQPVRCQSGSVQYRTVNKVLHQQVTVYAYSTDSFLGTTWKCLVDTGSVFSRPGPLRAAPIAGLFVVIAVFLLFVLKKLTSGQ